MGFRGEALASIGSVSHARILSCMADSDAAYEIFNKGRRISDPQAAAGNVGTTLEVRNLFFNTPGRRKFLRGPSTEFSHISETVCGWRFRIRDCFQALAQWPNLF